ncbi:type II toxin-antitoxin system death-on-curing family toxin [Marivirga arenosa]|uniref:Type II toxin-antitoxin system death-on-curing family toxin n=1 Tax=Marivirga arenosa TaxID=3059076 RepID=A0AA49JB48_9BACT|nr:type II toxin-antitoxin system death-on-curing family toxin [Marivirga sp. ABR2-2]WKK86341.1 type II toxin-antitoxin system death-on-curing family toxin [Marivirga sp. ABR2-2]
MISQKEALEIHQILIERFGGSDGIRDKELLNSALNRPYQTFDGKDLYPNVIDKAAAILESIVKNHPFSDGNKRTGYVLARLLMMNSKHDINASQDEKYQLVISISKGKVDFEYIKNWILKHSKQN